MIEYDPAKCAVFCKTKERFGGLSNMAAGFPVRVNGVDFRTSEALYQACRFPSDPDLQRAIIAEKSPMGAKMRAKPRLADTRPDWDIQRVPVMRWCLRAKLACNRESFGALLLSTGDMPIVELSVRDDFWGAKPSGGGKLRGENVLGELLDDLRRQLKSDPGAWRIVAPMAIRDFLLFGKTIGAVEG